MRKTRYLASQEEIVNFFGCTPTLYATFRVTGKCNLYCRHCYANANNSVDTSKEITTAEIFQALEELSIHGVSRLSVSGGEPFCRPDIYEILEKASGLGFDIYISTNGRCAIDIQRLRKIKIKVFQVSIDGLEKTHDRIRGKSGTYHCAMELLKALQGWTGTETGIAFSLMKDNAADVSSLFQLVIDGHLADIFSVIPVQKLGRAQQEDVMDVFELNRNINELAEQYLGSDKSVELNIMAPPGIIPKSLSETKYGMGYVCEFPYSIAVDENGNCAVCDGMLNSREWLSANIRDIPAFMKTFQNSPRVKVWMETSPNVLEGICGKCVFREICCGGCRANAFATTGNYYASDPLCQKYYDNGLFPEEYVTESL